MSEEWLWRFNRRTMTCTRETEIQPVLLSWLQVGCTGEIVGPERKSCTLREGEGTVQAHEPSMNGCLFNVAGEGQWLRVLVPLSK